MTINRRLRFLIVPALLVAWCTTAAGAARSPLAPDFLMRDAATIIESAHITEPDQQEVVLELIRDYDAQCHKRRAALNEVIQVAPESGSESDVVIAPLAATQRFLDGKAEDTKWLAESLRLVLTEQQLEGFESALRVIGRRRTLPQVEPPIGRIDLIDFVSTQLHLEPTDWTPEVRAILDDWELRVAAAMTELELFDVTKGVPFRVMAQQGDWEGALAWREAWLHHHLRVRDVTRAAAASLMPHLSSSDASLIDDQVVLGGRTFNSRTARLASAALKGNPTAEEAEAVRLLLAGYQAEVEPTRRALIEAQLEAEGLQHLAPLKRKLGVPCDWERLQQKQVDLLTGLKEVDDRWAERFEASN